MNQPTDRRLPVREPSDATGAADGKSTMPAFTASATELPKSSGRKVVTDGKSVGGNQSFDLDAQAGDAGATTSGDGTPAAANADKEKPKPSR